MPRVIRRTRKVTTTETWMIQWAEANASGADGALPAEVTRAVDDASPDDGTAAESAPAEAADAASIDVLLVFRKAINCQHS